MSYDLFQEYIKQSEPSKRVKAYAWSNAIGLQAVDGLKTSQYLQEIAIQNVEGHITIKEAEKLINSYYEKNPALSQESRTEEADKVSVRIANLLAEMACSFTPNEYISIHKYLFQEVDRDAGRLRDYNITKKEWVLNGENDSSFGNLHL